MIMLQNEIRRAIMSLPSGMKFDGSMILERMLQDEKIKAYSEKHPNKVNRRRVSAYMKSYTDICHREYNFPKSKHPEKRQSTMYVRH